MKRVSALFLAATSAATLAMTVATAGGSTTHTVKLNSTMFAAQVGSTTAAGPF
jgi:hypothetical protein